MKISIIRIGNSHGIRIPKPFLEQTGLKGEVEVEVRDGTLVVRPAAEPRAGWAAMLQLPPARASPSAQPLSRMRPCASRAHLRRSFP